MSGYVRHPGRPWRAAVWALDGFPGGQRCPGRCLRGAGAGAKPFRTPGALMGKSLAGPSTVLDVGEDPGAAVASFPDLQRWTCEHLPKGPGAAIVCVPWLVQAEPSDRALSKYTAWPSWWAPLQAPGLHDTDWSSASATGGSTLSVCTPACHPMRRWV